jgi:glyoxylase-like metal-dependent hydrolase (beta-lactamase superfamily II)
MLLESGVHCIEVATPFRVGPVNVYLIDDDPLTLIDTGPNWGSALESLERGLNEIGVGVGNLGLVLLTHQHIDHVGLAGLVSRRSGAEVGGLDILADYLVDYDASAAADDAMREATMCRHGIDPAIAALLRSTSATTSRWGASIVITSRLRPGDKVVLRDRSLRVLARSGHSPTDTIFVDEAAGFAFGGDHLLSGISSNALVDRILGGEDAPSDRRAPSLLNYRESLRKTQELDLRVVFGGHGPPVLDPDALIRKRLAHQDARALEFLEHLESGPLTAWELALRHWGKIAEQQPFLTMSEVLGHLDLLIAAERVVEHVDRDPVLFQITGSEIIGR